MAAQNQPPPLFGCLSNTLIVCLNSEAALGMVTETHDAANSNSHVHQMQCCLAPGHSLAKAMTLYTPKAFLKLAAGVRHVHVQVTRQFAMLHAKDGIRINSVNPGYVLTDVYGKGASDSPVTLPEKQALTSHCAVCFHHFARCFDLHCVTSLVWLVCLQSSQAGAFL